MTDARGAKRPKGRTLAEFLPLSDAEEILLACAAAGAVADFGNKRPESAKDANTVRGEFLRFLALGGDEYAPVHEMGVRFQGAWITEVFDLEGVETKGGLGILSSTFAETPIFRDAHVRGLLSFQGCEVPGVKGDRLICDAGVFLRGGFRATGEVRFLGGKIGGDFDCSEGFFENPRGIALNADGIVIDGTCFLSNSFEANGEVRFTGAKINIITLRDGRFSGNPKAIDMEGVNVAGALMIDKIYINVGVVNLDHAQVLTLVDDINSWKKGVSLNGFVYGTIGGRSPTDAKMRIGWIDRQAGTHSGKGSEGANFRPQPWQQLRKVLREMGHYEAAREIGIAFEQRKRQCGLVGAKIQNPDSDAEAEWSSIYGPLARFLHRGYGFLVDYGYRPLKIALTAGLLWIFCALFFMMAAWNGGFAPTSPAVFANQHYSSCVDPPTRTWADCLPASYPRFYPVVYSLNVLLPVGDLGQQATWRPQNSTWAGWLAQFVVWFETLFGWVASLVLVAVVSGLAKRDE